MANLAFQGLMAGSEHIPDSAFEKIPFAGPRYFKEDPDNKQQDKKTDRRRDRDRDRQHGPPPSDTDPYDDDESDREAERRARRSHRRSARDDRRRHQRGYDSDPESPAVSRGYNHPPSNDYPYFPPPPTQAVNEPDMRNAQDPVYNDVSQSYAPDQYSNSRDPEAQSDAYPPPPGPPPARKARARFDSGADMPRDNHSSTRSSVADKYRPHDGRYSPIGPGKFDRGMSPTPASRDSRDSPRPNYPSALALRPHSPYYGSQESLSPGYDSRYDDEEDRRHRARRPSSKGSRNRSSSRFSEAREKAERGFKDHKGELGAGALGALAGGLLGREFGGKKGNLGMVIGAALGGVGAGLYGARQEKHKQRDLSRSRPVHHEYTGYESY